MLSAAGALAWLQDILAAGSRAPRGRGSTLVCGQRGPPVCDGPFDRLGTGEQAETRPGDGAASHSPTEVRYRLVAMVATAA